MPNARFTVPTVITIFGVTGDLVQKKILAALFNLYTQNRLPEKVQFVGLSHRGWQDSDLQNYLADLLTQKNLGSPDSRRAFANLWRYAQGAFEDKSTYKRLGEILGRTDEAWRFCANKLFYLAVAPVHYIDILKQLAASGLTLPCSEEEGWTRVAIEKPFGTNRASAQQIDRLLSQLFKEEQIYRVDHYLGRETVRNIIAFRFSNSFLQPAWTNQSIEAIEINLWEKETAQNRGEYYDATGAWLDVGQNHLLQLAALFSMDNPGQMKAEDIRRERAAALNRITVLSAAQIKSQTWRAQYEGFNQTPGVKPNSKTETYFKIITSFESGALAGVPLILSGGKGLAENRTEVKVTFKHRQPCLCPSGEHLKNILHYHIKPDESIQMRFFVKTPGHAYNLNRQNFGFNYEQIAGREQPSDYEELVQNLVEGHQTLFISTPEIMAQWRLADPIMSAWQKNPETMATYKVGETPIFSKPQNTLLNNIGVVGLGKMGGGVASHLAGLGWLVNGYNRTAGKAAALEKQGVKIFIALDGLVNQLPERKIIWLSLTAGKAVDQVLFGKNGLSTLLKRGDIIIDAGNSFYKDTIKRGKKLAQKGIEFVDVGFSGGPSGARTGGSLMVGGKKATFEKLKPLLEALAVPGGLEHFEGVGAGHFVKMIHNGIEYGMMQAIAEGFTILSKSKYKLNLLKAASVYNHGSVIESRLVGWLKEAFEIYGPELKTISGAVAQTGEGKWTVMTAQKLGVMDKVIQDALAFRELSEKKPSYTGKIVSALRNRFGEHDTKVKKN